MPPQRPGSFPQSPTQIGTKDYPAVNTQHDFEYEDAASSVVFHLEIMFGGHRGSH